ncbi:hypothetical protein H4R99_001263 [Coemansia sp. RSA 1722]|nr:hypothetical protein IWW45_001704 [Coemansia sp. RSA 485]KAJ2600412.1 hypothetical protein GGF39_001793 [Coemansia sp. RSA 1721]KAJ2605283.1 hypothetical protein H4R99_001263 [Coemansia sp. RSA 1722]KAJ2639285.1 hypothetical protein GGF40_000950 [Coemansia sp. RSA 1286]
MRYTLVLVLTLATLAQGLPASFEPPRRAASEMQLYQGLHLPPGLRHSTNPRLPMHRRQIPYGGIISFGNTPLNIIAANGQNPVVAPANTAPAREPKDDKRPLLGLLDLDLDLHV